MHEFLHNKQSSETDRTIISTRQTRNDDHDRQIKARRRQRRLWSRKEWKHHRSENENETVASFIDHSHRSSSRLSYNTFDHCWVSLSCARIEHEIKTSNVRKISKSSIWRNMIVLRLFDKRLDRFEVCTDHSMIWTRQSEYKSETIKTNVKRSQMTKIFWLEKSSSTIRSKWVRKIVLDDLMFWTIIIFLLLSYTDDMKNHYRLFLACFHERTRRCMN
jgi:type III secretory pathway component EscV